MKKDKTNYKLNINLLILIVSILLFTILTILVLTGRIDKFDEKIASFMLDIQNDKLTNIMIIITNIGGTYALTVISILLLALLKNKKISLSIIINLVSVFFTSQIIKTIFKRSRPNGIFLTNAVGYSYPSGHSMVSFAFYAYISYLLYEKTNNKILRALIVILSLLIITLIGFSRVYLGVHFISDVLGGYLLAIAYLTIFLKIKNKKKEVK